MIARDPQASHKRQTKKGTGMTKLSLSRAWEDTMAVLAQDGRLFVSVALALFVLPGLILDVGMPSAPSGQFPPAGPWIAIAAVAILVSFVGQLAVIRLAIGPHITVGEAITHGLKRLAFYVAALLLWSVPIILIGSVLYAIIAEDVQHPSLLASIALIVVSLLGIFLAVRLILASAVASAETIGPIRILRRSWELAAGNWWRLFAFLLLVGIGAIALLAAVASVVGLLARVLFGEIGPLTLGGLLVAIVSQLLSALISVMFFVMIAQLYRQLAGRGAATVPKSAT
jgi:hypothetical protein